MKIETAGFTKIIQHIGGTDMTHAERAEGTITFTGQPNNNDTVTIGAVTFTFKTDSGYESTLTALPGRFARSSAHAEIKIGATNVATVNNLIAAARLTEVVHKNVVLLIDATGLIITVRHRTPGTGGNSFALAESATNVTVSGATLASGAAGGNATYPITRSFSLSADGLTTLALPSYESLHDGGRNEMISSTQYTSTTANFYAKAGEVYNIVTCGSTSPVYRLD